MQTDTQSDSLPRRPWKRAASAAIQATWPWLPVAGVLVAVVLATSRAWVCDDAYISYRYADNLVRGMGLVFNQGERVEGFTNLLWTLFTAAGLRLGIAAEPWTLAAGILCFAGTISLLTVRAAKHATMLGARCVFPIAATIGLATVHFLDFATSGLETSAFTLLALAGYVTLVPSDGHPPSRTRLAGCGALVALLSLTRPDGVLFAGIGVCVLLATRQLPGAVVFLLAFLSLWIPATVLRMNYFGEFFPNTYYAKSADKAWWSQGFHYVLAFFTRYWPLALGPFLILLGLRQTLAPAPRGALIRASWVELLIVVVYGGYVARVGGDFMFGRLLVPVVPFLLLLLERGIRLLVPERPLLRACLTGTLVVATAWGGLQTFQSDRGIIDERAFYNVDNPTWAKDMDERGVLLRRAFEGLQVRICFFGSEARMVYRSRVAVAVECETGLTDATIARQAIARRGRVGHEKLASLDYILDRRAIHFLFKLPLGPTMLGLDQALPNVPIAIGPLRGRMLTWDPGLAEALRARGVQVPDAPRQIDAYISHLDELSPEQVAANWRRLKRFYFDHVNDPVRAAPFLARLGQTHPEGQ